MSKLREAFEQINESKRNGEMYVKINKNYLATWRDLDDSASYLSSNESDIDKSVFGEIHRIKDKTTAEFINWSFALIKDYGGKITFNDKFLSRIAGKKFKSIDGKKFKSMFNNSLIHEIVIKEPSMTLSIMSSKKKAFYIKKIKNDKSPYVSSNVNLKFKDLPDFNYQISEI